jgi:uncharacterized protein YggT (Ycf19 family)
MSSMSTAQQPPRAALRWWLARALPVLTGMVVMLLLARLVARLLAARPTNPTISLLYAITEPLRLPLRFLDAQQPRFGATLEFSTLALIGLLLVLGYILWRLSLPRTRARGDTST